MLTAYSSRSSTLLAVANLRKHADSHHWTMRAFRYEPGGIRELARATMEASRPVYCVEVLGSRGLAIVGSQYPNSVVWKYAADGE